MTKSRIYPAMLMFLCLLIPFLFFNENEKSEALRFYESFVEPSELSTDENGIIYFHAKLDEPLRAYSLKYADRLEFDPSTRVSFKEIVVPPQNPYGTIVFSAPGGPKTEQFNAYSYNLLKYLDGAWYVVSYGSVGYDSFFGANVGMYKTYDYLGFLGHEIGYLFYSLPSGNYYLYISTSRPTESDGELIGHGAAMIEIELTKDPSEPMKRFAVTSTLPQSALPEYSVKVLGETLHHDPYA